MTSLREGLRDLMVSERMREAMHRALDHHARAIMDEVRGCTCRHVPGAYLPGRDELCPVHGARARRRARWLALPKVVRQALRGRWPAGSL